MVLLGSVLFCAISYIIVSDYLFLKKDISTIVKMKVYKEIIVTQWSILLLVCLAWLIGDFSWRNLFILESEANVTLSASFIAGIVTSIVIASITIAIIMKKNAKKERNTVVVGNIDFLFPQTKQERIVFLFVSATAGICEEIIFRGAMTFFLLSLPLDWSLTTVGIVGAVLFGLAHYYQGWKGILATGIAGYALFNIYIASGSLLLPIMLHFIIDAKLVFMPSIQKKELSI